MPNVFMTTYSMRVIEKGSGEILHTDNFREGVDLKTIFDSYITFLKGNVYQDAESQKALKASKSFSGGRTVSGIVETGDWGYEGDLFNIQSNSITYHRSINEAEMLPFYFLAGFPYNADEAILLMQRIGQLGMKSVLCEKFQEFFYEIYPGIRVEFYPLVPTDLINEYLNNGRILRAHFIKYGLPSDIADHEMIGDHIENKGYIEMTMHARKKGHLALVDRILEVIEGRKDVKSMYEIKGFNYDNVKVDIEINGRVRTVDMSHLERLRTFYDVTDEIEIGNNGHPVYESINTCARTLMNDCLISMGLEHVE